MIFSVFEKIRVLGYSWSTLLWYRCYYPHRSRDALSPVCGIFDSKFMQQNWANVFFYTFSKHTKVKMNTGVVKIILYFSECVKTKIRIEWNILYLGYTTSLIHSVLQIYQNIKLWSHIECKQEIIWSNRRFNIHSSLYQRKYVLPMGTNSYRIL